METKYQFWNADNIFYQIALREDSRTMKDEGQIIHFESFTECGYIRNAVRLAACILAAMDSKMIGYDECSYYEIENALLSSRGDGVLRLFELPPMKFKWNGTKTELGFLIYLSIKAIYISKSDNTKKGYMVSRLERVEDVRKQNIDIAKKTKKEWERIKGRLDEIEKNEEWVENENLVKEHEELMKEMDDQLKGYKVLYGRDSNFRMGNIKGVFGKTFGFDDISKAARKALSNMEELKHIEKLYEIQEEAKKWERKYDLIQMAYFGLIDTILKYRKSEDKLYEIVKSIEGIVN